MTLRKKGKARVWDAFAFCRYRCKTEHRTEEGGCCKREDGDGEHTEVVDKREQQGKWVKKDTKASWGDSQRWHKEKQIRRVKEFNERIPTDRGNKPIS